MRINPPGVVEVWWVATIANPDAPTVAELNGGVDLTGFARSVPTVPETGNTADTANLSSKFNTREVASRGGDNFTCEFYRDDTTDTAYDTLVAETPGHFVVAWDGLATAGTWAVSDNAWVYPGTILSRPLGVPGRDEVEWFTCEMAINQPPNEKYSVAA